MPEKDKNKRSWFSQVGLNAAMSDAPAIMQASGWTYDKDNNIVMGDPTADGPRELSKTLASIATMPLFDLGAELAAPYIIRGIKAGVRGYKNTKNLIKSRRIMKALDKAEEAGDFNAFYNNPGKNDIQSLSYFRNQDAIDKTGRVGRVAKVNYTEELLPEIRKYPSKQAAQDVVDYATEIAAKSKDLSTSEIMAKIAEDTKSLNSGDKVSLITDQALSKDSYPLYQQVLLRNQQNGKGFITVVKDGDTYRMIRLNTYGHNPKSLERIDKSIESLRKATGDPNIPGRISVGPAHYTPATEFTMFKLGGKMITKNMFPSVLDMISKIKAKNTNKYR